MFPMCSALEDIFFGSMDAVFLGDFFFRLVVGGSCCCSLLVAGALKKAPRVEPAESKRFLTCDSFSSGISSSSSMGCSKAARALPVRTCVGVGLGGGLGGAIATEYVQQGRAAATKWGCL